MKKRDSWCWHPPGEDVSDAYLTLTSCQTEIRRKGTPEVEFSLQPLEPRKKKTVKIPLEGFLKRPDRTTRIEMAFGFTGEDRMIVMIRDLGFGELFPATNRMIKQEVSL